MSLKKCTWCHDSNQFTYLFGKSKARLCLPCGAQFKDPASPERLDGGHASSIKEEKGKKRASAEKGKSRSSQGEKGKREKKGKRKREDDDSSPTAKRARKTPNKGGDTTMCTHDGCEFRSYAASIYARRQIVMLHEERLKHHWKHRAERGSTCARCIELVEDGTWHAPEATFQTKCRHTPCQFNAVCGTVADSKMEADLHSMDFAAHEAHFFADGTSCQECIDHVDSGAWEACVTKSVERKEGSALMSSIRESLEDVNAVLRDQAKAAKAHSSAQEREHAKLVKFLKSSNQELVKGINALTSEVTLLCSARKGWKSASKGSTHSQAK